MFLNIHTLLCIIYTLPETSSEYKCNCSLSTQNMHVFHYGARECDCSIITFYIHTHGPVQLTCHRCSLKKCKLIEQSCPHPSAEICVSCLWFEAFSKTRFFIIQVKAPETSTQILTLQSRQQPCQRSCELDHDKLGSTLHRAHTICPKLSCAWV